MFKLCPGDVVLELFCILTTLVQLDRIASNRAQYKHLAVMPHFKKPDNRNGRVPK